MVSAHLIIFIVIALGILLGAHFVLYFSVVRFFGVTGAAPKVILGGILLFLSVSFILASYAAHLQENVFTRAFYFFSGFWLGLLVNLLLAVAACWLLLLLAGMAGHRPGAALTCGLLFCLAFLYSVYGAWNASNPRVRNIQVEIRNLPDNWKGKTIVQLSDVHLGHVYKADFMQMVVDKVNGLHPDVVVITGDLFDGMDGALSDLVGPLCNLQAPEGVYFITGNHETFLGVERAVSVLKKVGVIVLNDQARDIKGLQLVGIGYPRRGEVKDIGKTLKSISGFMPGKPTILLYHAPVGTDVARDAGVNLQLAGHTHKGQIFPFGFITEKIYKGYDYGLHSIGDYSIYTTDGVGTWGPPMRTGNTPEIVNIRLE